MSTPSPSERFAEAYTSATGWGIDPTRAQQDVRCPAHDDGSPSLSVGTGRDGRVLLTCQAGCALDAVLDAVGLVDADLFPPRDEQAKPQVVASYPYADEQGTLLFTVDRYEPGFDGQRKTFRQRPASGKRGKGAMTGVRRVLYRLPALVEAIKDGATVFVVEGEKDADRLASLGLVATTCPQGAGKWKPEYTESLSGAADVRIIADNDDPGRAHAAQVEAVLRPVVTSVSVWLPAAGKDVSDHLNAGHSMDDLRPLTAPARPDVGRHTVIDVVRALRTYQHLIDPRHVLVSLATAVTTELDGEPLWMMLVGAPSGGKTEAIRLCDDIANARLDELTAAGLLSWTGGKTPRPVGALVRIGERGLLTLGDFSTVLASSDRGLRDQLFALLRRVYDGRAQRDLGNAPRPLVWEGRLTFLAAVTPAIDNYSSHADALGPRWLYWRLPEITIAEKRDRSIRARKVDDLPERRRAVREIASLVIRAAQHRAGDVELSEELGLVLDDVAVLVCYARAAVPRDGYGKREIIGMPITEEPPRLTQQLVQLATGLLALGLDEDSAAGICRRAALDSMPQPRRIVLEQLSLGEELTATEISRRTGLDRKVARFALEELRTVRVTACPLDDAEADDADGPSRAKPRPWRLAGEAGDLAAEVLSDARAFEVAWSRAWDEKGGPHTTTPQIGGAWSGADGPDTAKPAGHGGAPHTSSHAGAA